MDLLKINIQRRKNMSDTYLVTGAMGCIGAWTLYHLAKQGKRAISFDLTDNRQRLDLLMRRDEQEQITFLQGDLTAFEQVRAAINDHGVTHIIHLAALQVPMCRANPVLGAQVNVTGTVNIFEAAKQAGIKHLAGASSVAVYGTPDDYPPTLLAHDALMLPRTLYGVYKVAGEGIGRIYWQDYGISSNVLRPFTVYGVGRDQGLTSDPTKAMLAAAKGENFHIGFGGKMQFHYASDVGLQFIEAAEKSLDGAFGFNLGTPVVSVAEVAQIIMQSRPDVTITYGENTLPFPEGCDSTLYHERLNTLTETPLAQGIQATIEHFSA